MPAFRRPTEGEFRPLPAWAKEERARDLAWLKENLAVLFPVAQEGYGSRGRRALLIDTLTLMVQGNWAGHPLVYMPLAALEQIGAAEALDMARRYDPAWEFVVILLKPGRKESVYRIGVPGAQPKK